MDWICPQPMRQCPACGPPASRPSDDVANDSGAQELPVAPALLIRRELAQKLPFTRCAWLENAEAGQYLRFPSGTSAVARG